MDKLIEISKELGGFNTAADATKADIPAQVSGGGSKSWCAY